MGPNPDYFSIKKDWQIGEDHINEVYRWCWAEKTAYTMKAVNIPNRDWEGKNHIENNKWRAVCDTSNQYLWGEKIKLKKWSHD